jgi:SAM-dependent methyltransferase
VDEPRAAVKIAPRCGCICGAMSEALPQHLHSAAYFGEQRDFWWNHDYVALLARRLALDAVIDALDVGCGVGHWGRVLLPHMPRATLIGVDRERAWVAEAAARAAPFAPRATYRVGDASALPFDDASFDLVTCQTVLIHVPDVPAVLREMMRVLRPGGLLLAAEPNNLADAMNVGSARHLAPVDDRLAVVRLQMVCERGKIALGEGDNSVGEVLPGLVAAAGFAEVTCWLSDRAQMLVAPYAAPDQAAMRDDALTHYDNGHCIWSRADTLRYYLAGGGLADDFERAWSLARDAQRADVEALRAGTYHTAGGGVQHVVAARRPQR